MKTQVKKEVIIPISIIIPTRNSTTTILHTLNSISKQRYPIKEVIVVDNASADNSVRKVIDFSKRSVIPFQIIERLENKGVGSSYNLGVKKASSPLVVFMHSDSSLPTENEIQKLTKPLRNNLQVVASYPKVILPEKVWDSYNFWQKCLFARSVGKESPGMNGKFDCTRRNVFLEIGGFEETKFSGKYGFGGEDADLYLKLIKVGKIVMSDAKVIHLHYLGSNYSLNSWIKNRKLLARTYGRLLRLQGKSLPVATYGLGLSVPLGAIIFMIKPFLAILPLIPKLQIFGILLLILYSFINSKKMYTTVSTLTDSRIFLLPFIDIFLVYYESFWMLEAFFLRRRRV